VLILGILGLAVLPPEHVHAGRTPDGHPRDVVHRHLDGHLQAGAGAHVAPDDGTPRWLDSPYVGARSATRVDCVDVAVEHEWPAAPPTHAGAWSPRRATSAVHDPPPWGPIGLRGPPPPAV